MADRYWVGGTASWDGTAGTKWALTSGGAGGQAVPTSADDVFFSNLSTGTCTISTGNTGARSINCTGFTGTLTGTAAITVSGSVTLVAGMTYSYTGTMTLAGTGTITSAGKTFGAVNISGAGITVTLGAALTQGSSSTTTFTLTQGTLALAGFTLTCGIFSSSNTNTRAISFGTGGITLTHNSGAATVLSMATMTNFSWTGSAGTEGFSYTRNIATGSGTGTITTGSTAGGTVSNAVNVTLRSQTNSTTTSVTTGSYIKNLTFGTGTGTFNIGTCTYNACGNLDNTIVDLRNSIALVPTFLASGTIRMTGTVNALGNVTVNGSGITVTLIGPTALGTANTFTLTQGTLDLNGSTLSTGSFSSSNTNTRAITFGSANIALTSTTAATTVLSMATATGFTWTGTGGFTRNMAATATVVFGTTGGTTSNAPNLTVNAGASALTITTGSYFKNLVFTGSTSTVTAFSLSMAGNLTLASGGTYTSVVPAFRASATVTSVGKTIGSVTVTGSGITVTLADAMLITALSGFAFTLTQGTFNLAGFTLTAPRFSSANSNTRAINFGSGGGITLTSNDSDLFRMDTATNFTWSGTGGITLTGGGSNGRFDFGTLGGATASNVLDLTITTAAGLVVQFASGSSVRSINCPSGNPSLQTISGTTNLYGNLTLIAGVGSGYGAFDPVFRASATITSAGKSLGDVAVNGAGITVTLADAFVSNGALTLSQGTFANPSNFNVTAFNFVSNSGSACSLSLGSSTWTITGGDATTSWVATNASLTFSAGTSTINLTYVGVKEFFAGNRTYYNVNVGGTGDFYIYGTNTFNNITNSVQPATVIFESGLTQTVSNFGLSGTAGNLVTISSEAPGFQFTLSKASGTVNAQYLSIQDSVATGGAVWNAFTSSGNVDAGNNTGWIFSAAGGNMFLMFI
jgi:uncharacterized protein YlxW (UPF0749 family)